MNMNSHQTTIAHLPKEAIGWIGPQRAPTTSFLFSYRVSRCRGLNPLGSRNRCSEPVGERSRQRQASEVEQLRHRHNEIRPHSILGPLTPVEFKM